MLRTHILVFIYFLLVILGAVLFFANIDNFKSVIKTIDYISVEAEIIKIKKEPVIRFIQDDSGNYEKENIRQIINYQYIYNKQEYKFILTEEFPSNETSQLKEHQIGDKVRLFISPKNPKKPFIGINALRFKIISLAGTLIALLIIGFLILIRLFLVRRN